MTTPCPVETYARDVTAGRIVAGRLVRLACQRHLDDLVHGHLRGLKWNRARAQVAIDFFGLLRQSKGRWRSKPLKLEPWQQFIVGSMFGWLNANDTRRFQYSHIEVARKNGKTTKFSGIAGFLLLIEGEPAAEIYSLATKKDQAKLMHAETVKMLRQNKKLARRITFSKNNLYVEATDSKYEPLGSDSETLDGLNPSGCLADELHAWKDRLLWDVMETATGSREQPFFAAITTAGTGRTSLWWEQRTMVIRVLEATVPDDAVFGYIATLDEGDDWTDERVWIKANPNLGVSVFVEELRQKCKQAQATPGKQNTFKRLRLNMPTEQSVRWLDMAVWDRTTGDVVEELLAGRECYSSLDLALTTDLVALSHFFPATDEDPFHRLLVRHWTPEDTMHDRGERDGAPYEVWAQEGHIRTCEGSVILFDDIEDAVRADAESFVMKKLVFDPRLANQLIQRLMADEYPVESFAQTMSNYAGPTKEFAALLLSGQMVHDACPLLRWEASNVAVVSNDNEDLRPTKSKSTGRIDGIVAGIMSLGAWMKAEIESGDTGGVEFW